MKKIIACTFISLFSLSVFSQTKFELGLQASPNFSWVNSDISEATTSAKLKFNYGLIAEFQITENYIFSTGIGHGYDGGLLNSKVLGDDREINYAAQFLNIPLLLKMRTKEIGYFRYFALFGLTTGIKVNEKVSMEGNPDLIDEDKSYINLFKVALSIGLGAEYSLGGNTRLFGSLTFNNNFTNMIDKDESILDENNSSNKFNNVAITLGVIF